MFLFGYFLGDGWVRTDKNSQFFLVFHDRDYDIIDNMLTRLNITHRYIDNSKKIQSKCKTFACCNFVFYQVLKKFGHKSHNKKIPQWVQNAPTQYIEKFIQGYTKADGHQTENAIKYTTVSKHIAFGLQRLYLQLGKIISVLYQKRPSTYVIQGRTVFQRNTYSCTLRKVPSEYYFENNFVWYKVRKLEMIHNKSEISVYDFNVSKDHTYSVQNLIVHNCHSIVLHFYVDGKYLDMFCYNRSSDLFLDLPFNIASTALLQTLIACVTDLTPRFLNITLGDCHIYKDHYTSVSKQLQRHPFPFPKLHIENIPKSLKDIEHLSYSDLKLENYNSHSTIA